VAIAAPLKNLFRFYAETGLRGQIVQQVQMRIQCIPLMPYRNSSKDGRMDRRYQEGHG
jgi:hypothetical protein